MLVLKSFTTSIWDRLFDFLCVCVRGGEKMEGGGGVDLFLGANFFFCQKKARIFYVFFFLSTNQKLVCILIM